MHNWSHRLSVRTRGFHPRKRGSIPLGTAKMSYFVYMLISHHKNKIYSYVGYTKNIKKRLADHNNSKGAKYTKGRIWDIIYKKKYLSKSKAMKEEYLLKKNIKLRKNIKRKYLIKNNV